MLTDKKILLGICGGIAVYKVADWLRELKRLGAEVTVVMTDSAAQFVTPLTFAALSGRRVHSGLFDPADEESIPHINLARDSDLILIAPATANTMAKLANGLADDLLSTLVLAAQCPIVVCPAMNTRMYQHPATQVNLRKISDYGYHIVEPGSGPMACNEEGPGRLPEWDTAREAVLTALAPKDLTGRTVLITAGPTREPLDPVRYLGNRSSGKMGYALARTAHRRGAKVILVSGPVTLPPITGVETLPVQTAQEMHAAVMLHAEKASVIVKAAAVSDFRPSHYSAEKIKKAGAASELALTQNPDILSELGRLKTNTSCPSYLVGFAAESRNLTQEGWRKLKEKNLDLIVVNDISATDAGFGVDTNRVILLERNGSEEKLPLMSKERTADQIWDRVTKFINKNEP